MAITAHLDIDQGSDFVAEFTLENDDETPVQLGGFSVYSQFRKNYRSTNAYNFQTAVTDPINGKISLSLSGSSSSNIKPGRYLYDVEIVSSDGAKTRVVEGIVTINPEITRVP